MPDSLEVMKVNFGEPDLRVRFGERKCVRFTFQFSTEIQNYGHALDNVYRIMDMDWFLTAKNENGKRNLVCGKVNKNLNLNIINIDVDKNVDILSSPLFEQRLKPGYGFEVVIEGMDNLENITPKQRARGGFWVVFSPVERPQ